MTLTTSSVSTAQISTSAIKRWQIDASHSSVGFSVRQMMITNVKGEFAKFEGAVSYDPKQPKAAKVSVSIDVSSITTRDDKRDTHLRSADFFNAEQFPTITFESRRTTLKGSSLELAGELSIHGTTREVTLTVGDITEEHADPDVFSTPDVFDLDRPENRHLAFAAGPHFCLGAPLARLHAEVAISTLVERFPELSLAEEPKWLGSLPLRQLERLQVKW